MALGEPEDGGRVRDVPLRQRAATGARRSAAPRRSARAAGGRRTGPPRRRWRSANRCPRPPRAASAPPPRAVPRRCSGGRRCAPCRCRSSGGRGPGPCAAAAASSTSRSRAREGTVRVRSCSRKSGIWRVQVPPNTRIGFWMPRRRRRDALLDEGDAEGVGLRRERRRHRLQAVSVGVGLEDRHDPGRADVLLHREQVVAQAAPGRPPRRWAGGGLPRGSAAPLRSWVRQEHTQQAVHAPGRLEARQRVSVTLRRPRGASGSRPRARHSARARSCPRATAVTGASHSGAAPARGSGASAEASSPRRRRARARASPRPWPARRGRAAPRTAAVRRTRGAREGRARAWRSGPCRKSADE